MDKGEQWNRDAMRFVMWIIQTVFVLVLTWVGNTLTNLNREVGEFKGSMTVQVESIREQVKAATTDPYRAVDAKRDFALQVVRHEDLERRVGVLEKLIVRTRHP